MHGELWGVLSQQEADDFMAAAKVVSGQLDWIAGRDAAACKGWVEVGGARVGTVVFVASLEFDHWWSFNMLLHGDEVYRLDIRPLGATPNHPNPWNRPEGFEKRVRGHIHEHIYIEGLGVECARTVDRPIPIDHAAALCLFSELARSRFGVACPTPPNVQYRMRY